LGGIRIHQARSWPKVSAIAFSRPKGEAFWCNEAHGLFFTLTPMRRATVEVVGERAREFSAGLVPWLRPAGFAIRTVMDEAQIIGILQAPELYRDIEPEVGAPGAISIEPVHDMNDPVVAKLIQAVVREIDASFTNSLRVEALNNAIAVRIARRCLGRTAHLPPAGKLSLGRLARVIDYIDAHLTEALSLSEIAAIGCLSPFHFSRCFRRSMGLGLHEYVVRRRIDRARILIERSALTLAEIALAVGFDSQASFTARFSQDVGISPGRFRRERA
jgi:AraC family transcriptional regulator